MRLIINSLGKIDDMFLIDDRIFLAAEIGRVYARVALMLAKVLKNINLLI